MRAARGRAALERRVVPLVVVIASLRSRHSGERRGICFCLSQRHAALPAPSAHPVVSARYYWQRGGELIASFLDADEIDEFDIRVIRTLIGKGIPLMAPPSGRAPALAFGQEVPRRRRPTAPRGCELA
jgi:dihydrofolate reductase